MITATLTHPEVIEVDGTKSENPDKNVTDTKTGTGALLVVSETQEDHIDIYIQSHIKSEAECVVMVAAILEKLERDRGHDVIVKCLRCYAHISGKPKVNLKYRKQGRKYNF